MVKVVIRTLMLVSVICFASCNGNQSSATSTEKSSTPATYKVNNPEKISPQAKVNPTKKQPKAVANPNFAANHAANPAKPEPTGENAEKIKILNSIPNSCSLISKIDVSKILDIPAGAIVQMDASSIASPYTKSCFFKWDSLEPNSGILVQVQGNPIPDDYAEWVSLYVSSKRSSGENGMDGEVYTYKKLDGLGDDGSYSHRLGKYVWRTGEDYVFTISFRANSDPKKQLKLAKELGEVIMRNYKRSYKKK